MIRIIILLVVLLVAVVASAQLIEQQGYILISVGDWVVESTVFAFVLMTVFAVVIVGVSLKALRGGLNLSANTWHKFFWGSKRKAERQFNQGLAAFALDDYSQAEKLLVDSAHGHDFSGTAYLLAASAAEKKQAQQLSSEQTASAAGNKHYLDKLEPLLTDNSKDHLAAHLAKIKLLVNQGAFADARKAIDNNHKLIGHDSRLLTLEVDLCLQEKRFAKVVEYLALAGKQKAISSEQIARWRYQGYLGLFEQLYLEGGNEKLVQYWQNLARKQKQDEEILLAYCRVLAAQKVTQGLDKLLLPLLKKDASEGFLKSLRSVPVSEPDNLLAAVQKHLQKNTDSSKWLACYGHLALSGKQWQMAEKALVRLLQQPSADFDQADIAALAKAQAAQGNYQAAHQTLLALVK